MNVSFRPFWLAVSLLSSISLVASATEDTEGDYSWARAQYPHCADQILGAHERFVGRPFSTSLVVTVRVLDSFCAERQVTLVESQPGDLRVITAQVRGEPIEEQLFTLHQAMPTFDPVELCSTIAVDKRVLEADVARALLPHVAELRKRRFSLTPKSLAVVHGRVYSVWITSGQWEAHFGFSDVLQPEVSSPIASWADSVLVAASARCPKPGGDGGDSK